jgi:excisionase family DNA binding protein
MIEIRVGDLAKALGVHRNTIRNWIKNGGLKADLTVGKKYIIDENELTSFFQSKGISLDIMNRLIQEDIESTSEKKESYPQTPIIIEEVPMLDKPIGSVMVVGGGIAGIQSALDLADSGYYVYLLEKGPGIGGGMAKLDKTFPTNDCAM